MVGSKLFASIGAVLTVTMGVLSNVLVAKPRFLTIAPFCVVTEALVVWSALNSRRDRGASRPGNKANVQIDTIKSMTGSIVGSGTVFNGPGQAPEAE